MTFLSRFFFASAVYLWAILWLHIGSEDEEPESENKITIKNDDKSDKATIRAGTLTMCLDNIAKYSIDDRILEEADAKGVVIEMNYSAWDDKFEVIMRDDEKRVSFYARPDIELLRKRIIMTLDDDFPKRKD